MPEAVNKPKRYPQVCGECLPHTRYERFDQAQRAADRIEVQRGRENCACVVGQCHGCGFWYVLATELPLNS